MLTEIYIEALLVDKELADQVWEAWDKGEIDDQVAAWAWCQIVAEKFYVSTKYTREKPFRLGRSVYLRWCSP